MSDNINKMQEAINAINICNRCVDLYEAGKEALAAGIEMDIPAEKVTELKQAFAAARTACKAALDAITA